MTAADINQPPARAKTERSLFMTPQTSETPLLSVEEAAQNLGITPLNVLIHVKRGRLRGREIDRRWHIETDSLEAFRREIEEQTGPSARATCRTACQRGGCDGCR
jgi:hypothetical protein